MSVLQKPATWALLGGGIILIIGMLILVSARWRKDETTEQNVRLNRSSERGYYTFCIGAVILVSGALLLVMPLFLVLLLAGLTLIIWGSTINRDRRIKQEPRGFAGDILAGAGIGIILSGLAVAWSFVPVLMFGGSALLGGVGTQQIFNRRKGLRASKLLVKLYALGGIAFLLGVILFLAFRWGIRV